MSMFLWHATIFMARNGFKQHLQLPKRLLQMHVLNFCAYEKFSMKNKYSISKAETAGNSIISVNTSHKCGIDKLHIWKLRESHHLTQTNSNTTSKLILIIRDQRWCTRAHLRRTVHTLYAYTIAWVMNKLYWKPWSFGPATSTNKNAVQVCFVRYVRRI